MSKKYDIIETPIEQLHLLYEEFNQKSSKILMGRENLNTKKFYAIYNSEENLLGAYSLNFYCINFPSNMLLGDDLYVFKDKRGKIGDILMKDMISRSKKIDSKKLRVHPINKRVKTWLMRKFTFDIDNGSTIDILLE